MDCKSFFSQEVEIRAHGKEASCFPVEGTGMFGWCNVMFPDFFKCFVKYLLFHSLIFSFIKYSSAIYTFSPTIQLQHEVQFKSCLGD